MIGEWMTDYWAMNKNDWPINNNHWAIKISCNLNGCRRFFYMLLSSPMASNYFNSNLSFNRILLLAAPTITVKVPGSATKSIR